jgi:hypothetical protein
VAARPKLGFEQLCRGLRADLGVDGLIVLVAKKPPTSFTAADKIVAVRAGARRGNGYMPLVRAIEELTPDYRARVLDDPMLDLDFVHLRLCDEAPVRRHVVEINGQDFGGFRKSDLKFLRLLLLAAARKNGKDDGWLDKSRLRDGSDKDPALNDSARRPRQVRPVRARRERSGRRSCACSAARASSASACRRRTSTFDASLAELTFVATTTTTKKDGTKTKPTKKQEEGLQNAATLLRDCRRLGAPGEVEDAKTPAATSRRGRSAP